MSLADRRQTASTPWRIAMVLVPFGVGYVMSYLYRAVNAVAAPDLVRDVGLSAGELGFLTATYLLAFAGFQVPLGVLLDRYGPRRVQTALIALTGLGALIFALAGDLFGLSVGRALIGMGCAGGLMAGFKAVALWVSEERRALANSTIMAAGGVGILVATVPAEMAIQAVGWRGMFLGLVAMSLAVAALIFLVVPERAERPKALPLGQQIKAVGTIYSDSVFWRLAPLVALTAGVQVGVQTLWAGPWLRDVAGLDRQGVASYLAMMAVGFLVGTLTIGAIADWLGRKGVGLLTVMLGFILVFMACEAAIIAEWTAATAPLWFVFGMIGQSAILAYPWLASYFGVALAGRANTALNFLTFSSAFLTQYVIGAIIDLWPKTGAGGYAREAYQAAFGAFLILQCLALLWFFLKRPDERARAQTVEVST